jgi:hypothetical protein
VTEADQVVATMCKPIEEGGQRCATHTRKALRQAKAAYGREASLPHWDAVAEAYSQHASTPSGRKEVEAELVGAPAASPHTMRLQASLERGEVLRERNQAAAAAVGREGVVRLLARRMPGEGAHRSAATLVDRYRVGEVDRDQVVNALEQHITDADEFDRAVHWLDQAVPTSKRGRGGRPLPTGAERRMLVQADDYRNGYDLASRPDATAAVLDKVFHGQRGSGLFLARTAIARHTNTSTATLDDMAADPQSTNESVAIAGHDRTSTSVVQQMQADFHPAVAAAARANLARRAQPAASRSLLQQLATASSGRVIAGRA